MASDIGFCMRREIPNAAVGEEGGEGGKEAELGEGGGPEGGWDAALKQC